MNWLNFYTPKIRSEEFAEASEEQVGIWFRLVTYCCEQENKGMIHGADKWTERKWSMAVGVARSLISKESPLWHFSAIGSLIVAHYPTDREEEVRKKRNAGKRTAELRWGKTARKSRRKNSSAISSASSCVNAEGEGEDKEKTLVPTFPHKQISYSSEPDPFHPSLTEESPPDKKIVGHKF